MHGARLKVFALTTKNYFTVSFQCVISVCYLCFQEEEMEKRKEDAMHGARLEFCAHNKYTFLCVISVCYLYLQEEEMEKRKEDAMHGARLEFCVLFQCVICICRKKRWRKGKRMQCMVPG